MRIGERTAPGARLYCRGSGPLKELKAVRDGGAFVGYVLNDSIFSSDYPVMSIVLATEQIIPEGNAGNGVMPYDNAGYPAANRSLIAFTAWSSFVHAMLMAGQAFVGLIARGELIGSAVVPTENSISVERMRCSSRGERSCRLEDP